MYTADNVTVEDVLSAARQLREEGQKIEIELADLRGEARPIYGGLAGRNGVRISMESALKSLDESRKFLKERQTQLNNERVKAKQSKFFTQAANELNALQIGRMYDNSES